VSTIEIGAQSMDEQVLNVCGRGHTAMDTRHAVSQIKSSGYTVGVQMMVGLPLDTEEKAMATTREIVHLSPDFVRIYPTVVLFESVLARWYEKGDYHPLSLEQAVLLVKRIFLECNSHGIRVIRMGLQPSEELNKTGTLLAGPYHPAFGHLVYSAIALDRLMHTLAIFGENISRLDIRVHPKNISRVRGMKNQNLAMIKKRYEHLAIAIAAEERLAEDRMMVNGVAVQLWNRV
jgi:histone acetyltransferase (RNA polymerase elongator complex component)